MTSAMGIASPNWLRGRRRGMCGAVFAASLMSASFAGAGQHVELAMAGDDLASLSLESLMNIEVVSASKYAESLQDAAAAIYVLSGEDIRRSGVRTLVEALRLVPGLTVARSDSHSWVVTARGFSSTLADKLEVLMDGRSLYTPLFSGVFWEVQDTFLEDIDRIEVIRGPGAALWGSNAVNGVINIVTKSAGETQGLVATAGGGGEFDGFGAVRQGGRIGEHGHYRVYAKSTHYKPQERRGPGDAEDRWYHDRAGFRTDWMIGTANEVTVQGDIYEGELSHRGRSEDEEVSGYNLIGRWTRNLSETSSTTLQLFYDYTERDDKITFAEDRETYDIDFKHQFLLGWRQQIVWGGGFRLSRDDIDNLSPFIVFTPDSRDTETYNLFVQDRVDVIPEKLSLIFGSKIENNDYSGTEIQPSVRFSYTPTSRHTVWGAVSRAVRIPNRLDHDVRLFLGRPPTGFVSGTDDFGAEEVKAYELGYRSLLAESLTVDLALYYNDYDELRGLDNTPALQPAPSDPLISNEGEGHGSGLEAALHWKAKSNWTLIASYNYQDLQIEPKSGSTDNTIEDADRNDPRHQAMLRSLWDVSERWQIDGMLRYVDDLPDQEVPDYIEWDLRVGWKPTPNLEFSVVGRNLLDSVHPEFSGTSNIEITRSVHATATWRLPR